MEESYIKAQESLLRGKLIRTFYHFPSKQNGLIEGRKVGGGKRNYQREKVIIGPSRSKRKRPLGAARVAGGG